MKILITLSFLLISIGLFGQNVSVAMPSFDIISCNTGQTIKSCLPMDAYVANLVLPQKEDQVKQRRQFKRVEGGKDILIIRDGYWDGDCLMIPVEDRSTSTIHTYINQITGLNQGEYTINKN